MRFHLGLIASVSLLASPALAAPVVSTNALEVRNLGAAPLTFTFTFTVPLALTGMQSVSSSLAGVYADGARNGAAVGVGSLNASGHMLETSLSGGNATTSLVHGVGGADSFAGAGGTAGQVSFLPVAAKAFTASPVSVALSANNGTSVLGRQRMYAAVGATTVDGGTDGVSLNPSAGQNLADFIARRTPSADLDLPLNASTNSATPHGALLTSGATEVDCGIFPSQCDGTQMQTHFTLSGDNDATAMLLRQELGGDDLTGTVMDSYEASLFTSLFDCDLIGGCLAVQQRLSFTLSPGDAFALTLRVQVDDVIGTEVPVPGSLPLFALGLAAMLVPRSRRANAVRKSSET